MPLSRYDGVIKTSEFEEIYAKMSTVCSCGGVVLEWTLDTRGDWRWMPRGG